MRVLPQATVATAAVAASSALALALAPQASAAEPLVFNYAVSATTTVAKMKTTTTTTGTARTEITAETGAVSSNLQLKEFVSPVKLFGLQVGQATIRQVPVGPSTGTVNFTTKQINLVQRANLHIVKISPVGLPWVNLVGSNCKTATPASIPVSGQIGATIFDPVRLKGTFTIPSFKNCGLLTPLVTSQVSGPGNTIDLTLTPQ